MKNSLQLSAFPCILARSLPDLLCLLHEYLPGLVLCTRKPAECRTHACGTGLFELYPSRDDELVSVVSSGSVAAWEEALNSQYSWKCLAVLDYIIKDPEEHMDFRSELIELCLCNSWESFSGLISTLLCWESRVAGKVSSLPLTAESYYLKGFLFRLCPDVLNFGDSRFVLPSKCQVKLFLACPWSYFSVLKPWVSTCTSLHFRYLSTIASTKVKTQLAIASSPI